MIHIDRDPNPPDIKIYTKLTVKALDGTTKVTKAKQELEKAIAFFTSQENFTDDKKLTKKNFSFKVYKDSDLIEKLEVTFLEKCVYCESRFAHVTPKDIEHFRPKSEINTGTKAIAPGYYWLAGDWNNLLISCPDCNRSRKHAVPGQSKKVSLGKSTQFPLDDESRRVRNHQGDIGTEEEVRLLLNPCLDQPEEYLTFDENGLVNPRVINGQESKIGHTSIVGYALQRKTLVEERLRVLNDLRFQFSQLRHLVEMQNDKVAKCETGNIVDKNLVQIQAVSDHIVGLLDLKAPYLCMLREWILKAKAVGEFDDLMVFGIDPGDLIQN